MNERLLAETLGQDTTTQLWGDGEGGYRVRVMALPEGGAERANPVHSPRIFQDQPVSIAEARALFGASAARRYAEAGEAFPDGA